MRWLVSATSRKLLCCLPFPHSQEHSEVTALASGDPVKLKSLARKYQIAHTYSYEQYADCLASGAIDAVYIALPNHMHRAYAEAAARAGIHILCEKPMAFEEAECEAMIAEAERAKVKLMIAYRLHFERGNLRAIQVVNSGKIGEPRIFTSSFSQQVRPGNSRLKKDIGGGPVYDLGVYCINAARYLFRAEPEEVLPGTRGRTETVSGRFPPPPRPCCDFLAIESLRLLAVSEPPIDLFLKSSGPKAF